MIPPIIITILTFISFIIGATIILITKGRKSLNSFVLLLAIFFPLIGFALKSEISITLFQALFFVVLAKYPSMVFRKNNKKVFVILLIAILLVITSLTSIDITKSLWGSLKFISYLLFYLWTIKYIQMIGYRLLYKYFIITLTSSFVFVIGQIIFGNIFTLNSSVNINTLLSDESTRYFSQFLDPQTFGHYLVLSFFVIYFFQNIKIGNKYFNTGILVLISTSLLMTFSKAPIIALLLGLVLFLIRGRELKTGLFILLVTIFLINTDNPLIKNKINNNLVERFNDINESSKNRQVFWTDAIAITKDNINGIGFGNYQKIIPHYNQNNYFVWDGEIVYPGQSENGYLYILVSAGLLTFIIIFGLIFQPFFGYNNYRVKKIFFPLFLSLFAFLISFISVYSLDEVKVAITFFMVLALYENRKTITLKKI